MRIKSYTAESVADALKRIRTELGGEAFVLKTRKLVNPLGMERVEITACCDDPEAVKPNAKPDASTGSSRIEKAVRENPALPNAPAVLRNDFDLSGVHKRLDDIERKLAALFSQMAEKQSN